MKLTDIQSQINESVDSNKLFSLIQNKVYGGKMSDREFKNHLLSFAKQAKSRSEFFASYDSIPVKWFEVEDDKEIIRNDIESHVNEYFNQIEGSNGDMIDQASSAALEVIQSNKNIRNSKDLKDSMIAVAKQILDIYDN